MDNQNTNSYGFVPTSTGGGITGTITTGSTFTITPPQKWNFCPGCGKELQQDWSYCCGCGKAVGYFGQESPWIWWTYPTYPWWNQQIGYNTYAISTAGALGGYGGTNLLHH